MGVLIRGMEMPRSCFCCRFRANLDPDNIKCLVSGEVFEETFKGSIEMRHSGECPLVEVPTPHGLLIDADALAHDLDYDVENDQRALDEMDFVGKERESVQFDKDCKQNCMWYLSDAPTIIEAEEETNGK